MRNFKALVKMANKEIERVETLLRDKAEVFETRNLKLYSIAWNDELQEAFGLTDEQYYKAFDWFCEDSYRFFTEWMEEEGIDKGTMQYIGHSSSFNLIPRNGVIEIDRYDDVDFETSLINYIANYMGCSNLDYVIDDNGRISLDKITKFASSIGNEWFCMSVEEAIVSLKEDIMHLTENILDDFEYMIEDADKIHSYLKDFKDNQVEIFREFLDFYIEEYIA